VQLNLPEKSGFTLGELTVALALLGLLLILLLNTLASHQKVFRNFRERVLLAEQLREGRLALTTDIRGTAITADTLRLLSDSAFEFFSTIGSSVVCGVSGQVAALVPTDLTNGIFLSSIPLPPDTGDLLAAYSRIDSIPGTRRWIRFRISAVATAPASTACPATSGFTNSADAQKPGYRISLVGSTADLFGGAPVRILRRGRYSLYKSSEGEWYLGYKRCNAVAAGCSAIQPVSGPYLPYSAATGGGLRFRYLDSLGAVVPSTRPLDVAAIEITIRAEVDPAGRSTGRVIDSAIIIVTPRNLH
jgi:type II secretory pathway pseudopilin PulG